MNATTEAKIKMLKSSMRCLVFGLLGLIPVIGLPFALAALWISGRVRASEKQLWNAARPYRIWGVVCAATGTILWTGVLMIIIARALMISQGLG
jgi:TRAP-type mannitol/chloroaromatic compound transport system permease small subunit